MIEREKMYAGKIYDPFTEGMPEDRAKAHRLCKLYNDTFDEDAEERAKILAELMPHNGRDVYLQGPIHFDFGYNIAMGDGSYANFNFTVIDEGRVTIGKNVFIGPNVTLATAIHPLCWEDRNAFFNEKTGAVTNLEYTGSITVIGAGAVVTRDIPPHVIAVGNPCRVLREITEADRLANHPERFAE